MTCPKCDGTGAVLDPRCVGEHMRELREKQGISLRSVAKTLGVSVPYASDLERGRRGWRTELVIRYKKALEKS